MSARDLPIPLPPVPHVPGRTARPPEDLFDDLKAGLSADQPIEALADSAAYLGGLEALRRRYYWEAHELLEAVWACLPPAGAERHLVGGLIQLANAGLKARMGRARSVSRILALAERSIAEAFLKGQPQVMGQSPADLGDWMRRIDAESSNDGRAK